MSTLSVNYPIHGLYLDLVSECDVGWVDDSFSHEFGTEHCGHAEVEHISKPWIDGDLRREALKDLQYTGRPHRRRLFIKWLRRIRREVERLDPDDLWTEDQLDAACENWEPPEPDYDPPDWEPGISSWSYD